MSIIERTRYGRLPKVPPTNEQRRKAWEDKYRQVPLEVQIGDVLQRDRPAGSATDRPGVCEFCGYEFDHALLGKYGCPDCEGSGLGNAINVQQAAEFVRCTTDSD